MVNIILQIIIIYPQIALGIIFCLLVINKFDLVNIDEITGKIKLSSASLLRISVPAIITAFFSVTLRQLGLDLWFVPLFLLLLLSFSTLLAYKIKKISDSVKLFFSICLMVLITGISEFATTPMIMHIKGITVYDVFDSFYINFMSSIPTIIIFFSIDVFLFTRRVNFLNISVFKLITRSRILTGASTFLLLVNLIILGVFVLIVNDKVLDVYPIKIQIVINVILITFPVLNLGGLWFLLYSVKYKEAMDMRIERDEMIREVSVANERSRLARDVHDTLGHSLTVIIKLLEVCKITSKNDPDKINRQLEEAIRIAQNGVQEIKHSVSGILTEKILNQDLLSLLMELASEFENNSGITVNVTTQGTVEEISKKHVAVLYSVCQEALTNSLRHGNAKNVAIVIKFESESIKLTIFDDGVGCGKIHRGFGLNGMEQRIGEVNGKMSYKSDKGQGFILNFEVPREEASLLA